MTKCAMIITSQRMARFVPPKGGNHMTGSEAISMITLIIAILTLLAMIIFGIINIFKK